MSKFSELKYKDVIVENQKIGEVRDVIIDTDEWKVTHLIVDLTKEAVKEILGSPKGMLNTFWLFQYWKREPLVAHLKE